MAALADLENLEEYLAALQRLEIVLKSSNSPSKAIVDRVALVKGLYQEDPEVLKQVRDDLSQMLTDITTKTAEKGKLMSSKAVRSFVEKSEAREISWQRRRAILQLARKKQKARMDVYVTQLEKELSGFRYDIKIFMANAKAAGFSQKEALAQLIKAAQEGVGPSQDLVKTVNTLSVAAARREAQASAMEGYMEIAKPGEEWEWIAVSSRPCPDCQQRAGKVLPLSRWEDMGLPGQGRTVCGVYCQCQLGPVSVFDELFPDAKQFTFDKKNVVLTTAAELRTLNSKAARGE